MILKISFKEMAEINSTKKCKKPAFFFLIKYVAAIGTFTFWNKLAGYKKLNRLLKKRRDQDF